MIQENRLPTTVPRVLALLLSLSFFVQCYVGSQQLSLTWDEPSFISSGYIYLTKNDFRLNPSHPPLMQELAALPLLTQDLAIPDYPGTWFAEINPVVSFGKAFIFASGNDPQKIALLSRLPVMFLGAMLILAIYGWGEELFGPWPALAATALAAFCPNLLAHAKVATEDLGCTALMFTSTWLFWRATRSRQPLDWALCGGITGLALLSKYTALLLIPFYFVIIAVLVIKERNQVGQLAKRSLLLAAITFVIVGAGYNFTFDWYKYVDGIFQIYRDLQPGTYFYYLLGSVAEPRWYFNLVGLAAKTPLPILLALTMASWAFVRRRERRDSLLFLLFPAALIIGVAFFDRANLGLRRILPALPFLLLFTANAVSSMPMLRARQIAIWLLVVWTAIESGRMYPHHLSYINSLFGGPERGPYIFEDSNFDWGQDLPALAAWQREHPDQMPMKLLYAGTADYRAYGVSAEVIPNEEIFSPQRGTTYAVSSNLLIEFRRHHLLSGADTDWLAKYTPEARAGYSIFIYRFP